jgi:hypothetical protein
MSHPGIMTRAQVVATWLRDNQVPPDVRAAIEEWLRSKAQESAPLPGVSSPSGNTPPPDDAAPLAGGGADNLDRNELGVPKFGVLT